MTDNQLAGPGLSCLVEFESGLSFLFSRVIFSNNNCHHVTSPNAPHGAATVWLHGSKDSRAVVSGNQILSGAYSVNFHDMKGVFVGNSVSVEAIGLPGAPLPNPQNAFNLVG